MDYYLSCAHDVIERCRLLAQHTEEPGFTTRTFLSQPMREVHAQLRSWMEPAGVDVSLDGAGNLRGVYGGRDPDARRLYLGSHLDTVPRAGAFDGVLGVVLAIALVELLDERQLGYQIEIIGFSEEEGVRFGTPFIGSRALAGTLDEELLSHRDANGTSIADAIRAFGIDPSQIGQARATADAIGYLEFHIEQGPVLDSLGLPLAVVESIVGQSRLDVTFEGRANHAGTTPMHLRRDALAGAAEWVGAVEREANTTAGLVATVGRLHVEPGAGNVIAGQVNASLDARHPEDTTRYRAVERLLACAKQIGERRSLTVSSVQRLDQGAVAMDAALMDVLDYAVVRSGYVAYHMPSGAGHDAMILAPHIPTAMLFLRSPGGISHHPDEAVQPEDVAAALISGLQFLEELETRVG